MVGFPDFLYKHIVPACFLAPLKPTFDLSDAQTVLVSSAPEHVLQTFRWFVQNLRAGLVVPQTLSECALTLKMIHLKRVHSSFLFWVPPESLVLCSVFCRRTFVVGSVFYKENLVLDSVFHWRTFVL